MNIHAIGGHTRHHHVQDIQTHRQENTHLLRKGQEKTFRPVPLIVRAVPDPKHTHPISKEQNVAASHNPSTKLFGHLLAEGFETATLCGLLGSINWTAAILAFEEQTAAKLSHNTAFSVLFSVIINIQNLFMVFFHQVSTTLIVIFHYPSNSSLFNEGHVIPVCMFEKHNFSFTRFFPLNGFAHMFFQLQGIDNAFPQQEFDMRSFFVFENSWSTKFLHLFVDSIF
mmetsp:Transcript_17603/g.23186  ORF Transcript_17603/g.23186 Transcript_17603/m.23186 type:complete len:226 (-) Transcript_17603:2226-2903(-)